MSKDIPYLPRFIPNTTFTYMGCEGGSVEPKSFV
jgi:hypothetical protein